MPLKIIVLTTILRLWDTLHDPRGPDAQRHICLILDPDESAVNIAVYLFYITLLVHLQFYHLLGVLKQHFVQDTSLWIYIR